MIERLEADEDGETWPCANGSLVLYADHERAVQVEKDAFKALVLNLDVEVKALKAHHARELADLPRALTESVNECVRLREALAAERAACDEWRAWADDIGDHSLAAGECAGECGKRGYELRAAHDARRRLEAT